MKENNITKLWEMSTKNHCKVSLLWVFVFNFFVTRKVKRQMSVTVPVTVTMRGRLFIILGSIRVGVEKMNFEKNHPEIIVPIDNRRRAPLRFSFSSPIGVRADIVGFEMKQNTIIRNLYTAVRRVAINLNRSPSLFKSLALAASKIRSFE